MKKRQLGEDIINMYKPYRAHNEKWKVTTISKQRFQITDRYEITEVLGQGTYGIVVAAKDKEAINEEKNFVAIKKIDKAFENKRFAKNTLRELKLLQFLKHENVINIETIILPKSREEFEDVYVVSQMMDADLTHIIMSNQPLLEEHLKYFLYQLLRGLKYIHSAQVVHRDLKPGNIFVNSNCDLKIGDFGLARRLMNLKLSKSAVSICTRWYRAPELLLNAEQYTTAVDMWSVGCIFAEMLLRKYFLPGVDTMNQIQLICMLLGIPDAQDMKYITEQNKQFILKLPLPQTYKNGKNFHQLFAFADPQAIDLLKKMLMFNPEKRITAIGALSHPYLSKLHQEQDEPSREPINLLDFEFEEHNLTTEQLKDLLYEQALLYNNKQFFKEYVKKKANKQSLITHILKNSNASYIDPFADVDVQD